MTIVGALISLNDFHGNPYCAPFENMPPSLPGTVKSTFDCCIGYRLGLFCTLPTLTWRNDRNTKKTTSRENLHERAILKRPLAWQLMLECGGICSYLIGKIVQRGECPCTDLPLDHCSWEASLFLIFGILERIFNASFNIFCAAISG